MLSSTSVGAFLVDRSLLAPIHFWAFIIRDMHTIPNPSSCHPTPASIPYPCRLVDTNIASAGRKRGGRSMDREMVQVRSTLSTPPRLKFEN
ncbi:hypothetical protein BDZ91DRAFT_739458 [Kalaharituber pfeilii]|nr:hypothetical protein BDZ91DRAFT_739458 [Kalaharituber pfeilii]